MTLVTTYCFRKAYFTGALFLADHATLTFWKTTPLTVLFREVSLNAWMKLCFGNSRQISHFRTAEFSTAPAKAEGVQFYFWSTFACWIVRELCAIFPFVSPNDMPPSVADWGDLATTLKKKTTFARLVELRIRLGRCHVCFWSLARHTRTDQKIPGMFFFFKCIEKRYNLFNLEGY